MNIASIPPSGERPPLFIVGDVHGCAFELHQLLKLARSRVSDCKILMVGDLFTKGPDPCGVMELIREYEASSIKGNHDWALISSILHSQRKGLEGLADHTRQTLRLIRYNRRAILAFLVGLPHVIRTEIASPRKGWGPSYPMALVHAGIDPLVGIEKTSERALLTARWVRCEGEGNERRLVLMHSTSRRDFQQPESILEGLTTVQRSETATIAPQPIKRRWHDFHTGPDLIVFGHDAKQGLFRKTLPSGRPICVGLDTGCTYGRALTGYFPEFDDAIHVSAQRTYFDMSKNLILLRQDRPVADLA